MLYFLLGFLVGGLLLYWKGRRDGLSEYAENIMRDIKRREAAEERAREGGYMTERKLTDRRKLGWPFR